MTQLAAPETVTFPYYSDPTSLPKDVSVDVYPVIGPEIESFSPDTALFCGLGNEGHVPAIGAERLGKSGVGNLVLVSTIPHWEAVPDKAGTTNMNIQATQAVASHIREVYGTKKLHAIGESLAGPAILEVATEDPQAYDGRLALLRSLGFNELSVLEFMLRMGQTGVQLDQLLDPRVSARVTAHAALRVGYDALHGGAHLDYALKYRGAATVCQLVAAGRDIKVYSSRKDKLFTTAEQDAALGAINDAVKTECLEGSHTSPASKRGVRQVAQVVGWCQGHIASRVLGGTIKAA